MDDLVRLPGCRDGIIRLWAKRVFPIDAVHKGLSNRWEKLALFRWKTQPTKILTTIGNSDCARSVVMEITKSNSHSKLKQLRALFY